MRNSSVYTLPEKDVPLTEEMIAVTMAKCSRNPKSFRDIAVEITEENASAFNEKYVVTYGHASVAEGAVPTVCFENVSILASKVLESMPRPAVQEKSTRYQQFDEDAVYIPKCMNDSAEWRAAFQKIVAMAFTGYRRLLPILMDFAEKKVPQDAKNRTGAVKGRAFDSARYYLPAGTQTNLAMRINALDAARLISKLKANPYQEMQVLGKMTQETLLKVIPTILKYADPDIYRMKVEAIIDAFVQSKPMPQPDPYQRAGVAMLSYDRNALENVLGAMVYARSPMSMMASRRLIAEMDLAERVQLLDQLLSMRGDFDPLPEEFSASTGYTFDIQVDYGAYRDLQRHRRLHQVSQMLTMEYGWTIPDDIVEVGAAQDFDSEMHEIRTAITLLAEQLPEELRHETSYLCPLASLHRTTYTMDLREMAYMIELRTKPQGHVAYRRPMNEVWAQYARVQPFIAKYIRNVPVDGVGVHS